MSEQPTPGQEPDKFKPPRPELRFVPDKAKQERIVRFRRWSMWSALAVFAFLFVLILLWRHPSPAELEARDAAGTAGSEVEASRPVPVPEPSSPASSEDPRKVAARAVCVLDSAVTRAQSRWQSIGRALPVEFDTGAAAVSALAQVRQLIARAESAAADVRAAAASAGEIATAASAVGQDRVRYGELHSAEMAHLGLLTEVAAARLSQLRLLETGLQLLAAGDRREFEVKQNAANAYLREAEIAEKGAGRLLVRVRQARRNLGIAI